MSHVITQSCCADASCVYACPVNCIHPTPDEPDFLTSEMLYIDPATCVDCGACVDACPVGAIVPGHRLPLEHTRYRDVNAAHYSPAGSVDGVTRFPVNPSWRLPLAPVEAPAALTIAPPGPPTNTRRTRSTEICVSIVGSGPSAMYAADELLRFPNVRVRMYERLAQPFGLARYGVAPDHHATRDVMRLFDEIAANPRLDIFLNTEIGRDISFTDLRARSHAVVWAAGADADRRLTIPGSDLPGVHSATEFVGWYNGHPHHAHHSFDLSTPRVVIIGTGNVALDVARILTTDPDALASTSISPTALTALRASTVEEVMIVGRRDAAAAAFTLPELIGLIDGGSSVITEPEDIDRVALATDLTTAMKLDLLATAARTTPSNPHIRFAFLRSPHQLLAGPDGSVAGIQFLRTTMSPAGAVVPTDTIDNIVTGLVLTSIGYRGTAFADLPFDHLRGIIPNNHGRVTTPDDHPIPGVYVTGWIKRGPTGFIGTNKHDSAETITALTQDLTNGLLEPHTT